MRKAGVDEATAMLITGHKTPAMFRRYDIKNEDDLREAQQKTMAYVKRTREQQKQPVVITTAKPSNEFRHSSATV